MALRVSVDDAVQTPLGKGIVREVRGGGRLVVDIGGRKVVVDAAATRPIDAKKSGARRRNAAAPDVERADSTALRHATPAEIDLHGLFVADALDRVNAAINHAVLDGRLQLRIIHGRSGGRIKAALRRHLPTLPPVRAFRLDPRNDGVTIVDL